MAEEFGDVANHGPEEINKDHADGGKGLRVPELVGIDAVEVDAEAGEGGNDDQANGHSWQEEGLVLAFDGAVGFEAADDRLWEQDHPASGEVMGKGEGKGFEPEDVGVSTSSEIADDHRDEHQREQRPDAAAGETERRPCLR